MGRICPQCHKAIRKGGEHQCSKQVPNLSSPRKREARTKAEEKARAMAEPWRKQYASADYSKARKRILDLSRGRCQACGAVVFSKTNRGWRKLGNNFGGVHHRVPLSKGGTNDLSNLVVLCARCHGRAHRGEGE